MATKLGYIILILILIGCKSKEVNDFTTNKTDTLKDTTINSGETGGAKKPNTETSQVYSNERFKDVRVEDLGSYKFRITGKGQIFEASFGWVVGDGHDELLKGFEMTDAGAPEWGRFSFVVNAVKNRPNSTLHLILFETSAKDGSRQYELPIFLY